MNATSYSSLVESHAEDERTLSRDSLAGPVPSVAKGAQHVLEDLQPGVHRAARRARGVLPATALRAQPAGAAASVLRGRGPRAHPEPL